MPHYSIPHNKENSEASQVTRMDEFTNQIKRAAEPGVDLIIMGDANLDSNKWNDPKFIHRQSPVKSPDIKTL